MRINWLVNEVFDGWEPDDTRLGGTEEGVMEWSKRLVQLGHGVTVYRNGRRPNLYVQDGVVYKPRGTYAKEAGDGVTINIKCPEVDPLEPTWYMTTETDATRHDLSKFEAVIWPSQWAVDNIPVNNKTVILPYGYDQTKISPAPKIPHTVLYASSPDRGLATLLEVWPEVVTAVPDAQLIVTYGAMNSDVPNAMFLGELNDEEMNLLYATSEIWCHPANGGELYGITGIKAQAAGCWPVYFPTMALGETVKFGTKSSKKTLAEDLIFALTHEHPLGELPIFPTWDSTTKQLLDILQT